MKLIWSYGAVGLLSLAAAALVAAGEPASAELKLVEASTTAATVGMTALGFLASPAFLASTPERQKTAP